MTESGEQAFEGDRSPANLKLELSESITSQKREPQEARNESQALARLAYNNGFGDFCFGRKIEHDAGLGMCNRTISPESLPNDAVFEELDGFIRTGVFRFFDLPFTIRTIIFEYICNPFYRSSRECRMRLFIYTLSEEYETSDEWWNASFEDYWTHFNHAQGDFHTFVNSLTSEQRQQEEIKAKEIQVQFIKAIQQHPNRTANYRLMGSPRMKSIKEDGSFTAIGADRDCSMPNLIRRLSHVNTHFRQELGIIFWTSVELLLEGVLTYGMPGFLSIRNFCQERPVACKMIKMISMSLDLLRLPSREQEPQPFHELLFTMASNLELETLEITLILFQDDVIELSRGEGLMEALLPLREIPVSQKFIFLGSIRVRNAQSEVDNIWSHERAKIWHNNAEKIKNFLLPNSLRKPVTDMSQYLACRKRLLQGTVENESGTKIENIAITDKAENSSSDEEG